MIAIESITFWIALFTYILSWLLYIYYFISKNNFLGKLASGLLFFGILSQTTSLVSRTIESGYFPMASWYEFLLAFSWALASIYLIVEQTSKIKVMGTFIVPISWILILIANIKKHAPQPLPPALRSYWFHLHASVGFVAYGAFAIAFGMAIMYLLQERNMKLKKSRGLLFHRLPPLEVLDHLSYRAVVFAFPMLTLVLISGAIWAEEAWGRYWGWDPKETASLVTWLFFAAYMHARITAGWRGRRAAILAVVGFVAILFTFFGVNYLSALHGYAV